MKKIVTLARNLRKNQTNTEKALWLQLRGKRFFGIKFKRQQPIDKYIVDFICFEKGLIIELDGGQHSINRKKDKIRDKYLKEQKFKVLRFWNNDVLGNIEGVLEVIRQNINPHPGPLPPKEGEGSKVIKV